MTLPAILLVDSFAVAALLYAVWEYSPLGDWLRFRFNMWKCWRRFKR